MYLQNPASHGMKGLPSATAAAQARPGRADAADPRVLVHQIAAIYARLSAFVDTREASRHDTPDLAAAMRVETLRTRWRTRIFELHRLLDALADDRVEPRTGQDGMTVDVAARLEPVVGPLMQLRWEGDALVRRAEALHRALGELFTELATCAARPAVAETYAAMARQETDTATWVTALRG